MPHPHAVHRLRHAQCTRRLNTLQLRGAEEPETTARHPCHKAQASLAGGLLPMHVKQCTLHPPACGEEARQSPKSDV